MSIQDPIFGTVDPSIADFWEAQLSLENRAIDVDLTIDDPDISLDLVRDVLTALRDAPKLVKVARQSLAPLSRQQGPDDPLKLYFQHHRDELTPDHLARILGLNDVANLSEDALLAALELQRIGAYPGGEDETFVVDFALPEEVTDYILSVKLDQNGKATTVDLES